MTLDKNLVEINTKRFISKSNSIIRKENRLISIVIPLYNEEKSIKYVLFKIPHDENYEILVVDDGSTDDSIKKVQEVRDKRIRIIKHKKNQGYGKAILTGFKYSRGDIIVTLDSDGQHNPEEISRIIRPIKFKKADIIIGSRYLGKSNYKVPLYVRTGEMVISYILWIFFGNKINNNQSGFRAFNKKSIECIKATKDTGMGFTTEILFRSSQENLRIYEIPITVNPRMHGVSRVRLIKLIKSILLCVAYYFFKKRKT
ncbi:MAG: glycosyltransferase family 2 protein [Candidatus Lokiarchaeota archaeon]|nr:glycosyltransferase family 2 protein [Candidatus Lokiarchaeota archaeon]